VDIKFEQYREKFRITEWRDGCVYRTESLGYDWFPDEVIQANRPGSTGFIYAAASTEVACNQMTIRRDRN